MIYYTIKPGDTIYKIAAEFGLPIDAILSANSGLYPYNLLIGQQIMIPVEPGITQRQLGGDTPVISENELNLRSNLRKLWEEHVAWTRMAIISAASDSPDLNVVVDRLLRNASDMAAALKPIYGDENAYKFGNLIYEHLSVALQLVKAVKAGNIQAAQNAEKQLYVNADQIANLLNSINPYINSNEFKKMLYTHLALTKAEALAQLNHEYEKSISLYDQIENQALLMADMMAYGIVKQFPNLFS